MSESMRGRLKLAGWVAILAVALRMIIGANALFGADVPELQRFVFLGEGVLGLLACVPAVALLKRRPWARRPLLAIADQNVVERYRYDAYGAVTVLDAEPPSPRLRSPGFSDDSDGASDVDNPYTFTGRRLDAESPLMQYRNRYYDADLGRFISRDPAGYQDGFSLYCYVAARPLAAGDPMGLLGCGCSGNHHAWPQGASHGYRVVPDWVMDRLRETAADEDLLDSMPGRWPYFTREASKWWADALKHVQVRGKYTREDGGGCRRRRSKWEFPQLPCRPQWVSVAVYSASSTEGQKRFAQEKFQHVGLIRDTDPMSDLAAHARKAAGPCTCVSALFILDHGYSGQRQAIARTLLGSLHGVCDSLCPGAHIFLGGCYAGEEKRNLELLCGCKKVATVKACPGNTYWKPWRAEMGDCPSGWVTHQCGSPAGD